MAPVFLSHDARCRETWRAAFPDLVLGQLSQPLAGGLVWALQPTGANPETLVKQLRLKLAAVPLVILADEPGEDGALAALAAGASGYCNGHAAAPVLLQVAAAIYNGGVWVGQGLMQRLLAATARLSGPSVGDAPWRATLTPREQEAAQLLAQGASNKEIARQLDITERTVKAHVGAMLEKLGARDRLQLSLIINGIEKTRQPA